MGSSAAGIGEDRGTAPIFGREHVIEALQPDVEAALTGTARAVLLTGVPGVGLRSVAREAAGAAAARGAHVVWVGVSPCDTATPLAMWIRIADALLHGAVPLPGQWPGLESLVRPERDLEVPGLTARRLLGTAPDGRRRFIDLLSRAILVATLKRPLVLVLEGVERADAQSWNLLPQLLQHLRSRPLLLLATAHEAPRARRNFAERCQELERQATARVIRVPALGREGVKQWLTASLGGEPSPELTRVVYQHTAGLPRHVALLVRHLVGTGAIDGSGGRIKVEDACTSRLPSGLDDLLAARVAQLDAGALLVGRLVALSERAVRPAFVLEVLSHPSAPQPGPTWGLPEVKAAVECLVHEGLLRPVPGRLGHVCLADDQASRHLLANLSADHAAAWHGVIAAVMERRPPSLLKARRLAGHRDQAGDQPGAYAWALRAALRAEQVGGLHAAQDALALAAAMAPDRVARANALSWHAAIAVQLECWEEAEQLCAKALVEYGPGLRTPLGLATRLLEERCREHLGQPHPVTAMALEAITGEAADAGAAFADVHLRALTALSRAYGRLGQRWKAHELAVRSVRLAETLGDTGALADALIRLGVSLPDSEWEHREVHFSRAIGLAQAANTPQAECSAWNNLGISLQKRGLHDESVLALQTAGAVARRGGHRELEATALVNLGVLHLRLRRLEAAETAFDDALGMLAALKDAEAQLAVAYNLAHVALFRNDLPDALLRYEHVASLGARLGSDAIVLGATTARGWCSWWLGDTAAAREAFAEVAPAMAERPSWFQGREFGEALALALGITEGAHAQGYAHFAEAVSVAIEQDPFAAAWLCDVAKPFLGHSHEAALQDLTRRVGAALHALGWTEAAADCELVAIPRVTPRATQRPSHPAASSEFDGTAGSLPAVVAVAPGAYSAPTRAAPRLVE